MAVSVADTKHTLIESEQSPAQPSFSEKFQQVCYRFNECFLLTLHQLTEIASQRSTPEESAHHDLLNDTYAKWYGVLENDSLSTACCEHFHKVADPKHELLVKRNPQLFDPPGDFFSEVYQVPGLQSSFLYYSLFDETSPDPPGRVLTEEDRAARSHLWDAILTQYQLSVILCLYLRTPLIKDIVEVIMQNNPQINQTNVMSTIMSDFKKNKKMRSLVMKLMKQDEQKFVEIMNSLEKVMSVFSSQVQGTKAMEQQHEAMVKQRAQAFSDLLSDLNIELLPLQQSLWINTLESQNETVVQALLETGVERETWERVKHEYLKRGLDKFDVVKMSGSLSQTMKDMFSAIQSKDETAFKSVMEQSDLMKQMGTDSMQSLSEDFEVLSKEWEEEAKEMGPGSASGKS